MTTTLAVEGLTGSVAELVGRLAPGDEIVPTLGAQAVARLVGSAPATATPPTPRPAPGFMRGMITFIADDFDAPLEDME